MQVDSIISTFRQNYYGESKWIIASLPILQISIWLLYIFLHAFQREKKQRANPICSPFPWDYSPLITSTSSSYSVTYTEMNCHTGIGITTKAYCCTIITVLKNRCSFLSEPRQTWHTGNVHQKTNKRANWIFIKMKKSCHYSITASIIFICVDLEIYRVFLFGARSWNFSCKWIFLCKLPYLLSTMRSCCFGHNLVLSIRSFGLLCIYWHVWRAESTQV